ncbi:MAG: hypothetical protein AAFU80_00790 [Pseudomonadota bacterium]
MTVDTASPHPVSPAAGRRGVAFAFALLAAGQASAAPIELDFSLSLLSEALYIQREINPGTGGWQSIEADRDPAQYGVADRFTAFGLDPGDTMAGRLEWSAFNTFRFTTESPIAHAWTVALDRSDPSEGAPSYLLAGEYFTMELDFHEGRAVYSDDRVGTVFTPAGLPASYRGYSSTYALIQPEAQLLARAARSAAPAQAELVATPLPAAWLALLAALGGLGWMRSRGRA